MLGYYKLDDKYIDKLPLEAKDIEDDIYDLCCPLIIGEDLPKDIEYLYKTLEVPIIRFEDYKNFDSSKYKSLCKYLKEFSGYLKLNTEIEMLEEGKVGHTLRVGRYVIELCKLGNVKEDEMKKIYIAGLFHDIGKIKVPKKIVSKPGKLTEKEFEEMRRHCEYAYDILNDYLDAEILDMVITHHERVNKSGYPKGITPSLGAKIIGIADSYDAMLSTRVYKKNKSLKATLEELKRCTIEEKNGGKGILYDKNLVDKFVEYHGYATLTNFR